MPCPGTGPCGSWDLDLSCCLAPSGGIPDPCVLEGDPIPQEVIDSAKLAASQYLWMKTGMQFGCCQVTLRPCKKKSSDCVPDFFDSGYGFPWYPAHLADGSWVNIACGCQDVCACGDLCSLNLPYPVCSVDEVKIDGVVVDPALYRVYDFKKLVLSSGGCWPDCNDLNKPDTEVGTWSVTVTYGRPVPELVRRGAEELACEFIKYCSGSKGCRLPQRVTSISRQGVTASFLDPMEFLGDGLTGIFMVDLAIKTYNPKGLYKRATVYSPDLVKKWTVQTFGPGDPTGPNCT